MSKAFTNDWDSLYNKALEILAKVKALEKGGDDEEAFALPPLPDVPGIDGDGIATTGFAFLGISTEHVVVPIVPIPTVSGVMPAYWLDTDASGLQDIDQFLFGIAQWVAEVQEMAEEFEPEAVDFDDLLQLVRELVLLIIGMKKWKDRGGK